MEDEKNKLLTKTSSLSYPRYATLALSVAAYHENNNEVMGRTKHCVETIVNLCRNSDEEIQTQAASTLANLGFASQKNQELIGACGGIDALVDLCRGSDVDVIEAATAALANIITLHTANGVKLAQCGGIDILSHLISSNQIVNLLDFDQVSEIQANAAECLANVTRNYGRANAARIHEVSERSGGGVDEDNKTEYKLTIYYSTQFVFAPSSLGAAWNHSLGAHVRQQEPPGAAALRPRPWKRCPGRGATGAYRAEGGRGR